MCHHVCHTRTQVSWKEQSLREITFLSGLADKDLEFYRFWHSMPEPASSTYFLVNYSGFSIRGLVVPASSTYFLVLWV